jgi:hypothetical protein
MKSPPKFRGLTACALLAAASLHAQHHSRPAVELPRVGKMLDARGILRTVSGIAGNFLAGPDGAGGVSVFACGQQACATLPHAGALAIDGKRAVAYLLRTNQFVEWNTGARMSAPAPLAWNPLTPGDDVLSILLTPVGGEISVRRGGDVWIVDQDGAALDTLPAEAVGPVLLLDSGVVYARDDAIVLRRPNGTQLNFPAPGVDALYAMSPGWVQAVTAHAMYALQTTTGHEGLYVLPDGGPAE